MAEVDTTNPLAVIVSFFALMLSAIAICIKLGTLGLAGVVAGLGIFFKIMWEKR